MTVDRWPLTVDEGLQVKSSIVNRESSIVNREIGKVQMCNRETSNVKRERELIEDASSHKNSQREHNHSINFHD